MTNLNEYLAKRGISEEDMKEARCLTEKAIENFRNSEACVTTGELNDGGAPTAVPCDCGSVTDVRHF